MNIKNYGKIALMALIATLSGCTVGPDYNAPAVSDSDFTADIRNENAVLVNQQIEQMPSLQSSQWWLGFNDEQLVTLIAEAQSGNYDIKVAQRRIDQARASLGISEAGYWPELNADGGFSRTRGSEATGTGDRYNIHKAGFDAGWELDMFGGVRRSVESATATLEATELALADVWVSLSAEVAVSYINLRAAQEQLQVAKDNLLAQQETLDLLESRYGAGLGNELEVQQARYNMETTRSTIPGWVAAVEAYENALTVLLGLMPGQLHERLAGPAIIPAADQSLIVSIPADVLRNRPDVRRAERLLAAQSARIGVATSELYPKFSLNGSIGLEALRIDRMTDSGTGYYSFGPSFRWNIFNADRIKNNIKMQDALTQEYLAVYEKTVLNAAAEVRNALVAWQQQRERLKSVTAAETAAISAMALANDQYKNGLTSFNNVLDTQRTVLAMQAQKVACRSDIAVELVRLYKAMAGGTVASSAGDEIVNSDESDLK